MAAGLEQANAAHAHVADSEFLPKQLDERHATGDNIAPGQNADSADIDLLGGKLQNLFLDETYCFVGSLYRIPGVAKESITLQTAIRECSHSGDRNHRLRRLRRDEDLLTLPCQAALVG
jgi:hypothetical protein